MSVAAIGLGVAAVAGVGSAVVGGMAASKAAKAQSDALNNIHGVDIPSTEQLASSADISHYQQQFQQQAQVDPAYAALRAQGAAGVLGVLQDQANPNSAENAGLTAYRNSVATNAPMNQNSINALIQQAQSELAAGATLPPSFQAEMVRSGLSQGGASGTGVNGEGASGTNVRTLLGTAGINLQAQRASQAESALGTAGSLQQMQQNAIDELTKLGATLNESKANLSSGAAAMGTAALPSIGLTGNNIANIAVGNNNQASEVASAQGNVAAKSATIWPSAISQSLGSVTGAGVGIAGLLAAQPKAVTPTSSPNGVITGMDNSGATSSYMGNLLGGNNFQW